jgi:hypothetical protein
MICAVLSIFILCRIWARCVLTVLTLKKSLAAISLTVRPLPAGAGFHIRDRTGIHAGGGGARLLHLLSKALSERGVI